MYSFFHLTFIFPKSTITSRNIITFVLPKVGTFGFIFNSSSSLGLEDGSLGEAIHVLYSLQAQKG